MRCPYCGCEDTQVKDSRHNEDAAAVKRRRQCSQCAGRFTTFERVQLRDLTIRKRNGGKVPFDRDKFARSIAIALRKRPVESEKIERVVNGMIRQLESRGEDGIASTVLGEMAMKALRGLDNIGYIRYASVYADFSDTDDFLRIINELSQKSDSDLE